MVVVLKNNKRSVLRQLLASSDTLVVVSDSTIFPTLAVGEYFYLTILRSDGASEIVKVLSVSGASLTVVRAQEGTVAREFPVGSGVEMRVTAASVLEAAADAVDALTLGDLGITATAAELNVLDGVTATTPTLNASVSNSTQTRDTVAALLADTTLTYTAGQIGTVTAGGYVRTRSEGFSYQVAASGATNHHVTTAGGVKLYVLPSADNTLPLRAFAPSGASSLVTAITAASASGIYLDWQDVQVGITSAVSVTAARVLWKANGAKITYTGADIATAVQINIGDGVDHRVVGSGLEVDGGGNANIGIRFTQILGTATASFYAEHLIARNCEKQIGASGAAGIEVRGGFSRVTLIEPEAHRMMIRTGAGTPGSAGIVGVLVQNEPSVAGAYCRNLDIIRPKIRRVYSQDPTYTFDMDGIGIFANPDVVGGNSYAKIVEPDCEGCWGRDVKSQFARCEIINPRSLVNEGPTPAKNFPIFDFQSGPGMLLGGNVVIDGVPAVNVVRYGTSTTLGPCSHVTEGGTVAIINGGSLTRFATQDVVPVVKVISRTKGVSVIGSLREFAFVRTNGVDIDYCFVEGVTATLTDALIRVESSGGGVPPYIANVFARNCVNLGSPVATLRYNVPGQSGQATLSQENLFGFVDADRSYLTNAATATGGVIQGLRRPEAANPSVDRAVGGERFLGVTLLNNAEFLLPEWGFDRSCIVEIKASANDRFGYALLSFDTGGFVNISVGSNFNIGTTADPGSGSYRVWRDGNQIRLKNAQGSTRRFTISMRG